MNEGTMTSNINYEVYQAIGGISIPVRTADGYNITAYLSEKAVAQIWLALRERGLDIAVRLNADDGEAR